MIHGMTAFPGLLRWDLPVYTCREEVPDLDVSRLLDLARVGAAPWSRHPSTPPHRGAQGASQPLSPHLALPMLRSSWLGRLLQLRPSLHPGVTTSGEFAFTSIAWPSGCNLPVYVGAQVRPWLNMTLSMSPPCRRQGVRVTRRDSCGLLLVPADFDSHVAPGCFVPRRDIPHAHARSIVLIFRRTHPSPAVGDAARRRLRWTGAATRAVGHRRGTPPSATLSRRAPLSDARAAKGPRLTRPGHEPLRGQTWPTSGGRVGQPKCCRHHDSRQTTLSVDFGEPC